VSAPSAVRSNLPAEADSFIGRRRELTEARRLLEGNRLVTVIGPGGVGKTRLALRVAAGLRRRYADGAYLVELSSLENCLLLGDTVLQALGVADQSSRPADDVLADYLSGRRVLLVLDNCEHLIDACAELVGMVLAAAPELRILATSREPLRLPGECVLEVPPTSATDAMSLFEERARAAHHGFAVTPHNRDTVVELCRRLDHLPLAIELAVPWLRVLSAEQILRRLDNRFDLLAHRLRDGSRHGSLQASLEWSAQTCSKPEQALWARASVFAGDFDLDGAEQVCAGDAVPREDVLDLLAGLVDKSILSVRRDDPVVRYTWLDTLRAYGRRLLDERGEEREIRLRHRDYCLGLTIPLLEASSGPHAFNEALRRLPPEGPNLRTALDWCLSEPGQEHAGLDLAGRLAFYWLSWPTLNEGRQWLHRALAANPEPSPERARALWATGWLAIEQGDLTAAEHLLAEAHELASRLGDEPNIAWAIALSGYAALFTGELDRARRLLEEGLARQRRLGNMRGALATMSGLAQTTSYLGDPVSEAISRQALALADEHRMSGSASAAMRTLGLELLRQQRLPEAVGILREALRSSRQLNHRYGWATCLDFLCWTAQSGRQPERAARLLGAARAAYRRIGATMPRPQRDHAERYATDLREALGEQRFAAAVAHGEQVSPEQAIGYALGEPMPAEPPAATDPGPLTRREQQVARLVAEGLSNKEIATTLVISQRTAESHVEHIMTKLGFTSRTQIAAWTAERPEPPRPTG
jgi:predicted ATPase/DNA-binding CsgD family transcriptional regulator